jgi:hypothetical protein
MFKIYIQGGICGLMLIASIFLTIQTSTNGSEFAKLQKTEIEFLDRQQELQQTLVESLSVNTLQEKSGDLGYTKVSNLIYVTGLVDSESVAKLP